MPPKRARPNLVAMWSDEWDREERFSGRLAKGRPPRVKGNSLAVASVVCSVAGFFPLFLGLLSLPAIAMGCAAIRRIRRDGGTEVGMGMAIAGIVIGATSLIPAIWIVLLSGGEF